jgi:DNA-binding CsgD family transcriptional regulator
MDAHAITSKLTEREKEVLRLWLDHKTAKEMALDLGITHHAVEKRLKMARVKLDAGSSLEAARMLAEAEGYEHAVAGPPEVPASAASRHSWRPQPAFLGGIVMFFAALLALALALAPGLPTAEGGEIVIEQNREATFDHLDTDGSGYLEDPESPFVTIAFTSEDASGAPDGKAVIGDSDDPRQIAEFYAEADTDADGRVSFREYFAWSDARWAELGIDVSSIVKILPRTDS